MRKGRGLEQKRGCLGGEESEVMKMGRTEAVNQNQYYRGNVRHVFEPFRCKNAHLLFTLFLLLLHPSLLIEVFL